MYASRGRPLPPHMGNGGRDPMDLEECVFLINFALPLLTAYTDADYVENEVR